MTIRFHESLARLIETVAAAGVPFDDNMVILRDGTGRLTVARETVPDANALAVALRRALGPYAGPRPLVTGRAALVLVCDPTAIPFTVVLNGTKRAVRVVERRFVGADWMTPPAPAAAEGAPRLVFASPKGGVGKTTALAVLAADLAAAGSRVLVIDFDLESPGLGSLLLEEGGEGAADKRPPYGVLDYLVEGGLGGIDDGALGDFVATVPMGGGSVDVVPVAGRITDARPETMMAKLARALVENEGSGGPIAVSTQVRAMVDRLASRHVYDAVLIDTRAGLAEANAPILLALGASVLFFGNDRPQTFRAFRYLFGHLRHAFGTRSAAFADWRRRVSFVQTGAGAAEAERAPFRKRLHHLCAEFLYEVEVRRTGGGQQAAFDFALSESGDGVPHDATFIPHCPALAAPEPPAPPHTGPDSARAVFAPFVARARALLDKSR